MAARLPPDLFALLPVCISYGKFLGMEHRHLKHCDYTMAAIDDIIARGGRKDWVELRNATADPDVVRKILHVCQAHTSDPYAQRYHLWRHYASRTAA